MVKTTEGISQTPWYVKRVGFQITRVLTIIFLKIIQNAIIKHFTNVLKKTKKNKRTKYAIVALSDVNYCKNNIK